MTAGLTLLASNPELIREMRLIGAVAETDHPRAQSALTLPEYLMIRQADYMSRKILNGHVQIWDVGADATERARVELVAIKKAADRADPELAERFADKIVHDVEWLANVNRSMATAGRRGPHDYGRSAD